MNNKSISPYLAKIFFLITIATLIILSRQFYFSKKEGNHTLQGFAFGTTYSIVIHNTPLAHTEIAVIRSQIQRILKRINAHLNPYQKESEIWTFNEYKNTEEPLIVSEDMVKNLKIAQEVYHQTGGYFDITVSDIASKWGFGPHKNDPEIKNSPISKLLAQVGFQNIELKEESKSLIKLNPLTRIDLSGIAKGYAVDEVYHFLESKNLKHFLVEIGGEVRCKGRNKKGACWQIGIDAPFDNSVPGERVQSVLSCTNLSLATSGDYRQFIKVKDQRLSHTINPKTGKPVSHNLASVTVLAESCIKADAYATALHVMGYETAKDWLRQHPEIEAFFILRKKNDTFSMANTPHFFDRAKNGFSEY